MTLDLEAIKKRAEEATPGPWKWEVDSGMLYLWRDLENMVTAAWRCGACEKRDAPCHWPNEADSAFIAAARSDVPSLIAEVDRLDRLNERLDKRAETMEKELRLAWRVADNAKAELVMSREGAADRLNAGKWPVTAGEATTALSEDE